MNSTIRNDRFGEFGGRYVPETLIPAVDEMLNTYVGRPSALSTAPRLSEQIGARVYLKREDLNHTGAHKINNTVGQVLLARRLGKHRVIAETGAGQHGVATGTAGTRTPSSRASAAGATRSASSLRSSGRRRSRSSGSRPAAGATASASIA